MNHSQVHKPFYLWVSVRAPAPCHAGQLSGSDDLGTSGEVPEGVSGWPRAGELALDFPSLFLRPADSFVGPCVEDSVGLWKVLWAERSVWSDQWLPSGECARTTPAGAHTDDHFTEQALGAQRGERTHSAHTALVDIWFCYGFCLVGFLPLSSPLYLFVS